MRRSFGKIPKVRKGAWFAKVRGSYLPVSWQGWLTYIPFIAYIIWPAMWVEGRSYPFSLAVFLVVPQWIVAGVVMTWVAARKS